MATTEASNKKTGEEFANSFNAEEVAPIAQTEDEAFPDAAPIADVSDAVAAAPAVAGMTEQQLKSWEGRLKAKETELAGKEAAGTTTNAAETETAVMADIDGAVDAEDDAGAALAADFGEDFVVLITKLVNKIVGKSGEAVSDLEKTVNEVIKELQDERRTSHSKAISSMHSDFMEVVESPEFMSWLNTESPEDIAKYQGILENGDADSIILMLTKFKGSKEINDGDEDDSATLDQVDSALDDAEGMRSTGMKLPAPMKSGKDDFAAAWNES